MDAALAADLDRNFISRWNNERPIFTAFVAGAAGTGKWLDAEAGDAIAAAAPAAAAGTGPATGQLLRTLADTTVGYRVPTTIREAFQNAIAQAQSFIYIENQYVRDTRLVTWLGDAIDRGVPVILVLPVAPEEVAQPGGPDPVTLKGMFLQNDIVKQLQAKPGSKFGAFSMLQKGAAQVDHATNFLGSFQIYVHSKTLIVDDAFAMIGSANTNRRSFEVDTEANISWYDAAGVKKLRLALWNEMLGKPADLATWKPADFVVKWSAIAGSNKSAQPKLRSGFVVPHDPDNPKTQGQDNSIIPVEWTELTDIDPDAPLPV